MVQTWKELLPVSLLIAVPNIFVLDILSENLKNLIVAAGGIEPPPKEPKSFVLPLY